jgi:hypothetical protein
MNSGGTTLSISATFTTQWTSGGTVQWYDGPSLVKTHTVLSTDSSYTDSYVFGSSGQKTVVFTPSSGGPFVLDVLGSVPISTIDNASAEATTTTSNGLVVAFRNTAAGSTSTYEVYDTLTGLPAFSGGATNNYSTWIQGNPAPMSGGTINNFYPPVTLTNDGTQIQVFGRWNTAGSRVTLVEVNP